MAGRSFKIFNVGNKVAKSEKEPEKLAVDLTDNEGTSEEQTTKPYVDATAPKVKVDATKREDDDVDTQSGDLTTAQMRANNAKEELRVAAGPKIKKINGQRIFNQTGGETPATDPTEWGDAFRAVKSGEGELVPMTATQGHSHSLDVANQLESFLKNVPALLEKKAAAHDKAAEDIESLVRGRHEDADYHRNQAVQIRSFLGTNGSTEGKTVRHNMRQLRDDIVPNHTTRALDRNLEFQALNNKVVDVKGKLGAIKGASGEFKVTSPTTLHPKLSQVHSSINALNDRINQVVGKFGVFTPISRARMALVGMQHDALQLPRVSDDVMTYQDEHPDSVEENKYLPSGKAAKFFDKPGGKNRNYWSKPGHIWGDKVTPEMERVVGKQPGGRDQIKISDENLKKLKARPDKTLYLRMKRAMDSLKRGQAKPKGSMYNTEGITSANDVVVQYKKAREKQELRDTLNPPVGGLRRRSIDPKTRKAVSVPIAGNSPKLPEVMGPQVGAERAQEEATGVLDREHHITSAIQGIYLNDRVDPEHFQGATANLNPEDAEAVASRIIGEAQNLQKVHAKAVETVRGGGRIPKAHRALLGPMGVAKVMADVQAKKAE